jgi:1,5-anhydro-D-fructose reductase (1,5-anhydro-D-mannitol-forming)
MLDWLVIGIGDITRKRVLPAILAEPRSRLAGIVTRTPAKAEPYGCPAWTSLEAALAAGAAQAVYVASPVFLHAPQTIAALEAGRHVLAEKPMAMNYAEAQAMVRAAESAARVLGVAYYRRCYPKLLRTRELLRAGVIGRPVLAEAHCHDWFRGDDGHRAWLLDPAQAGGGPLFDTATHRIDVFNFLFGEPVRVTAQLSNAVHQHAVEDAATVLIEYPGGVRALVDARRHSRVDRDEFRIIGTDGELDLTPLNSGSLRYPGGTEDLPPHANLHYPAIEDFVSAVLNGTPPVSSGATALPVAWVVEQALGAGRP